MSRTTFGGVVLCLLAAGVASADEPKAMKPPEPADKPAMMMPKPSEEVAAMAKKMGGTWKCNGDMPATPMGPAHKSIGRITWKLDLDKFWLVGTYAETKTKENPTPYKFVEYRIYDTQGKKWVAFSVDNFGGTSRSATSKVEGNVTTWEGVSEMGAMKMMGRGTETMVGPREVQLSGEVSMDGKTYMHAYSAVCKK